MQLCIRKKCRKLAFAAAFGFAATSFISLPLAFAQTSTTGSINGTVTDSSGAAVPGAAVVLKDAANGVTVNLTTNAEGRFTAPFLAPDTFSVSATAAGFQSNTIKVQVLTGQQSVVNVTVSPSTNTQTVQVNANDAQLIDTQTANLTTTFTTQQFQNLPAPGGDITTIAYTVPGVVVGAGTEGFGGFTSDGLPGLSNLVVINGADYNIGLYGGLAFSGSSNLTIGQQEIDQAAVVQNGYSVQYGRQAGVIETYATKSGANRVHGLAQWQYNSSGLNANDFFNNQNGVPRPKAVSNQYAAQVGGPIKHDKLFFFADTEGIRFVEPSVGFVNLPSQTLQNSILANPNITPGSKGLYSAMFKGTAAGGAYAKTAPVTTGPGTLQDPTGNFGCGKLAGTTDYATGGKLGTSVPEGCIDSGFINSVALNREWMAVGRLDWNISEKHRIYFRVTDDQGNQPTFVSLINPDWSMVSNQPGWTGQLNDTYTFNPNLTNQFIAAGLYYSGIFQPASIQAGLAASPTEFDQGIDGGTAGLTGMGQTNFFTASTTIGAPWVDFPGGVNATQYQAVDNISWLKGNHSIKFGFDFKRFLTSDVGLRTASYGGDYTFGSMADEAGASLPGASGSNFQQGFPAFGNIHSAFYNYGIYAQDEWKVLPNLMLDFGLRVDSNGNPTCGENCYTRYLGGFPNTSATMNTPYNVTLSAGHGSLLPSMEAAIVQPRFGFNLDLHGDGKTVVRGGVGLFADNFPALIAEQTFLSFPNRYLARVTTGTVAQDAGSAFAVAQGSARAVLSGFSQGASYNQIIAALPSFTPPNYTTTPSDFHGARYVEFSMQVQREITPTDAVILSYAGNHGYNLFVANNHLNQNVGPIYGAYGNGTFGDLPASSPDPRFLQVSSFANDAISNYNGVSVQYKHIDHSGLTTDIAYTYSHALDDISNGGNSQLPYNGGSLNFQVTPGLPSALMYSNSDYDIRNNFVMDLVYAEPHRFGNRIVNAVGAGWTVGAKAYWRSGEPFSVFNTNAGSALGASSTGGSVVLAQVLNNNFSHSCTSYHNPCFQNFGVFNGTGLTATQTTVVPSYPTTQSGSLIQPVQTTFGNVPRNSFRGPHFADVDTTLFKDVYKRESVAFQVGAQAYNVLNHVNFAQPNNNASALNTLGQISGDINAPTSPYGSSQQPTVSGRVLVVQGRLVF
jgi:Carboxypeptidase regulatory-like domain